MLQTHVMFPSDWDHSVLPEIGYEENSLPEIPATVINTAHPTQATVPCSYFKLLEKSLPCLPPKPGFSNRLWNSCVAG